MEGIVTRALAIVSVLIFSTGMVGCIGAPVVPPTGLIYTDMDAPLSLGGGGRDVGSKRGESSVTAILGLFSTGDGSVKKAAANGRITQIKHVDYNFRNIIGIYQEYTTVVYGD
jgi:hypothetical protein